MEPVRPSGNTKEQINMTKVEEIQAKIEEEDRKQKEIQKEIEEIDKEMEKLDENGLSQQEATGDQEVRDQVQELVGGEVVVHLDENDEEEVEVGGRKAKMVKAPQRVSVAQREQHELTHTPYQPWCKYCVKARGRNDPHKKKDDKDIDDLEAVPRVSLDYVFMSEED